jgi:hypothetical protein
MKALLFVAALAMGGAAIAQDSDASAAQAPGNSAPERDARGIPVVSDPATPPPGTNQPFSVPPGAQVQLPSPEAQAQAFTPRPDTGEKPPCSRTVTDNCVQTYERGRSPTH